MKVSELSGAWLDYWVGKLEGKAVEIRGGLCMFGDEWFSPTQLWSQGGPIMEREEISVYIGGNSPVHWAADAFIVTDDDGSGLWRDYFGDTYLQAAMRAYVASKFGEEVPDVE